VSGRPITLHTDPSSRLVLVGCDHRIKRHIALVTPESCEAYLRTEALEWAKRKGNPNAVITTLQPFKMRYANLLADFGFEEIAMRYIDSIRKCTGLDSSDNTKGARAKSAHLYPDDFVGALDVFQDRLCVSLAIDNTNKSRSKRKLGFKGVLSKIVPPSVISKPEEAFHDAPATGVSFDDIHDEVNVSFMTATSNLHEAIATSRIVDPPKPNQPMHANSMSTVVEKPDERTYHTMEPLVGKANDGSLKNEQKPMFMASPFKPSQSVHEIKATPVSRHTAAVSQETEANQSIPKAPKSEPIKLNTSAPTAETPSNRRPKPEAAPSSASSGWSISKWMRKKMNPDAFEADTGLAMEAYYDDKLKRWIFPGEDPAEVSKPLAPPPTTPMMKEVKENRASKSTPDDPLVSLMAPPTRPTPKADPLSSMMAPPSRTPKGPPRPTSAYTPMMAIPPARGTPSGMPTPRFVIFQPKTTIASSEPSEDTK